MAPLTDPFHHLDLDLDPDLDLDLDLELDLGLGLLPANHRFGRSDEGLADFRAGPLLDRLEDQLAGQWGFRLGDRLSDLVLHEPSAEHLEMRFLQKIWDLIQMVLDSRLDPEVFRSPVPAEIRLCSPCQNPETFAIFGHGPR